MTSEPIKSSSDRQRRRMPKALVWLVIAAIAAVPFPW